MKKTLSKKSRDSDPLRYLSIFLFIALIHLSKGPFSGFFELQIQRARTCINYLIKGHVYTPKNTSAVKLRLHIMRASTRICPCKCTEYDMVATVKKTSNLSSC